MKYDNFKVENRYVAFCDVLGFSNLVETNELKEIAYKYNELILKLHRIAINIKISTINYFKDYKLNYAIFSDSIFAWSESFSTPYEDIWKYDHTFLNMIELLFCIGIKSDFPLRIGVAYGECIIDQEKNLYLGIPLINAYLTECVQEWVGIGCHKSCLESPIKSKLCYSTTDGNELGTLIPYDVPVKDQSSVQLNYTLDWPKRILKKERPTISDLIRRNIAETEEENIIIKWNQTLEYLNVRSEELKFFDDSFVGGDYYSPS